MSTIYFPMANSQKNNEALSGFTLLSIIALEDPEKLRKQLPDFYSVYPHIKQYINKLILKDISQKTNYTKKPSVDVKLIAKKLGLKIILFSFENLINTLKKHNIDIRNIPNSFFIPNHAFLAYEDAIIFINKNDSEQEKLFSIAHEIFHFVFQRELDSMAIIADKKRIWTALLEKKLNIKDIKNDKNQSDNYSFASRFGLVARNNKEVRKEIRAFLGDIPLECDKFITLFSEALKSDISDMVEDEIADYFAANLLVPAERFILWDDKSSQKIANAFRTTVKCIEKRKIEIKNELEIMKPKNLSSGVSLEKVAL